MIMNSSLSAHRLLGVALMSVAVPVAALTPIEVQKQLAEGKALTIVDVRSREAFQVGHIPNAINIPASLVAQKQLPPLGAVVVYDGGTGVDTAAAAVNALNAKSGIIAVPLEGGLAAWESVQVTATTRAPGLAPDELPVITYDHLKNSETNDVVLVDLRRRPVAKRNLTGKSSVPQTLSDLPTEFPHAQVTESAFAPPVKKRAKGNGDTSNPPLLVLIDNGDGSAQEVARQLKANGVKRFAILAGGEEMIARKGQAGLNRQGSSIVVQKPDSKETPR